jgi:hypothetical protein
MIAGRMSRTVKKEIPLCDPYVWEDPRYLFRPLWLTRKESERECHSELVNHILLTYLIAVVIGFVLNAFFNRGGFPILLFILASLYLIPSFKSIRYKQAFKVDITLDSSGQEVESFVGQPDGHQAVLKDLQDQTTKGVRNPFHNVMIDEYKYEPNRPAAPDITSPNAKVALDEYFRVQWYSDPTDVFGKTQGQRMFITQPVTTIPNDQGSYQDWLYKIPGKTCKEGNPEYCYGGSSGAALPWLN